MLPTEVTVYNDGRISEVDCGGKYKSVGIVFECKEGHKSHLTYHATKGWTYRTFDPSGEHYEDPSGV